MTRMMLAGCLSLMLSACVVVSTPGPSGKAGGASVVLCHKNKKTMELPREAASAHLEHGDRYGPC
ncbi:MAG: hypothetical protein ACPHN2_10225 [Sinimarinibacterium flocculans]|uniref:hypothetical protein n=1 Tax=Sinimarinibacterium flocculans TaxID=985250 RepID=UPI002EA20E39|nr:hypothetical protein [Pseudomonadota bacterium]